MKTKDRFSQFLAQHGVPLAAATLALALVHPASAQPDANNAGKANNPNNLQMGGRGGGGGGFANMTPEQRQQMEQQQAQQRETMVRQILTRANYTDTALQDAIVAFVKEQDKAAIGIRDQTMKLRQILGNQAATDAQTATLLNDLHAAADTEKDRRTTATKALDAKINFSKQPKLEALLTVLGIIGDEAALSSTGNVLGGGMGGRGGMGGFGGMGFGGGMGGGNGFNGGGGRRGGNNQNGGNGGGGGNRPNGGNNAPPPAPVENNQLNF